MEYSTTKEDAVRCFAAATLGLLETFRSAENARLVADIHRITKESHEIEVAKMQGQHAANPLLLNARQAAKTLSISTGTLFNLSAPRGPIPVVKIGTRICYAVKDLEATIEMLKIRPAGKHEAT